MTDAWLEEMTSASPQARNIAWTGELIFAGAREDDRIGRTAKFDVRVAPEAVGKANPFATYTRRRAGHAGTRFHASLAPVGGTYPFTQWADEVMLLGWSDGPKGQTVTFLLSPIDDKHPFMGIDRSTQFMAVLLEISDDEAIVDQKKRERVERPAQRLSNVAAQVVKNPRYWEWAVADDDTEADAKLKKYVGITSKAQLDSDPERVKSFRQHMEYFVAWQKEMGYL